MKPATNNANRGQAAGNFSLPRWGRSRVFSLVAGLAVALMLHYLLYRIGLPSKPFIYVAF